MKKHLISATVVLMALVSTPLVINASCYVPPSYGNKSEHSLQFLKINTPEPLQNAEPEEPQEQEGPQEQEEPQVQEGNSLWGSLYGQQTAFFKADDGKEDGFIKVSDDDKGTTQLAFIRLDNTQSVKS